MYIYIYPSQSTIVAFIDCAIGKMVRPIRQSFLAQQKQVLMEDFAAQTTSKELFSTPSDFLVSSFRRHGNSEALYAQFPLQHRVRSEALYISMYALVLHIIAEPLAEAGNRGARSRNAFVCMYILYPSQSIIDASIDCAIGKMVRPIRQRRFLGQRKQVLIEDFAAQPTL